MDHDFDVLFMLLLACPRMLIDVDLNRKDELILC